jgi:hypothetical protein
MTSTGVHIRPMKKANGKRNRNKFPCNFCAKMVSEYARHVTRCHSKKLAVAAILAKPKKLRRNDFYELRLKAIKRHNMDVLDSNVGELIVSRRTRLRGEADDYLPCPECNAMMAPKQMWRHYKNCLQINSKSKEKPINGRHCVVRRARMLMEFGLNCDDGDQFVVDVLGTLRSDAITSTIKKDELIIAFGQSLYKRLGRYRSTEIAQRMRLLGRLLNHINKSNGFTKVTLMDCIDGRHFDDVLAGVEQLCGGSMDETGRCIFLKPSLGTKLGHSLLKCAKLKKTKAIRNNSKKMEAQADRFIALHQSDWVDSISSKALMTLKLKRLKGPEQLPQTQDLIKLKEHLEKRIASLMSTLKRHYCFSTYRNLLEYALAALILFNKRRGGEASKLLLSAYTGRQDWNHASNQEIVSSLSEMEKKLIER